MNKEELLKSIGAKIKSYRKANKLTHMELGKATNLCETTFPSIEKGRKNMHILTLKRIADVLKVDIKDFL